MRATTFHSFCFPRNFAQSLSLPSSHINAASPSPPITNPNQISETHDSMATCIEKCRASYTCIEFCPCPDLPDPRSPSSDEIWSAIRSESESDAEGEPILAKFYCDLILRHPSLESALANLLATKLSVPNLLPPPDLCKLFLSALSDEEIKKSARADLAAARDRDPACAKMAHCFLYHKGFLAAQAHRAAHRLWNQGRTRVALLIQSRVSEVFAVDIHPGARIGSGLLLDHATGIVVGETAVIGDDVSILHNVTLGGTGKEVGDRHPKIGDGVLVGAGCQILGNVRVGEGAKVGAGSVVLKDVPAGMTAVGNPARLVGGAGLSMDHVSWSDCM